MQAHLARLQAGRASVDAGAVRHAAERARAQLDLAPAAQPAPAAAGVEGEAPARPYLGARERSLGAGDRHGAALVRHLEVDA
jgi:hypothetical protein